MVIKKIFAVDLIVNKNSRRVATASSYDNAISLAKKYQEELGARKIYISVEDTILNGRVLGSSCMLVYDLNDRGWKV